MKYRLRIFSLLLLSPALSFSQANEVGFVSGVGYSAIVNSTGNAMGHYNFASVGVNYYRTSAKELLCLKTGFSFDYRFKPNDKWPYLRIPLGLDFRFGERFEAVAGAGIIFYYLPGMHYDYLRKFQLGFEVNSGIEYSFSEKCDINIMLQKNLDLSAMNLALNVKTQGGHEVDYLHGSDNFVRIGVKYKFSGK